MSHTNSTTNYGLPQFLTSDKPAWLTDVNNAFSDIDTAVYNAQTKADTAYTDAGNAQLDATTAINNAAAADAKGSGALASIESTFDPTIIYSVGSKVIYNSLLYRCTVAVVTPGPWTGSDNWERITVDNIISTTDSKIGLLSSLSTTDKTSIVNALNEVNGAITSPTDITSDFITMAAGYTFTSGKVYKQGKHIFGNIVVNGSIQGGNDANTVGTIKSDYRTTDPVNGFCGISNGQWFTNNIGYVYMALNGALQVATTPNGMTYAKIHIDYVTA